MSPDQQARLVAALNTLNLPGGVRTWRYFDPPKVSVGVETLARLYWATTSDGVEFSVTVTTYYFRWSATGSANHINDTLRRMGPE